MFDSSDVWRANQRDAEQKLDSLRREHGQALLAVEAAASKVAGNDPEGRKALDDARERVSELADSIDAAVAVVDAAQREYQLARAREEDEAAIEREKQTRACAQEVTAAAEQVEALATKLQRACCDYMSHATKYGLLTGHGRDFAHPAHNGKIRSNLRNLIVTTIAAVEIPGYTDRTRGLLKPQVHSFLD